MLRTRGVGRSLFSTALVDPDGMGKWWWRDIHQTHLPGENKMAAGSGPGNEPKIGSATPD